MSIGDIKDVCAPAVEVIALLNPSDEDLRITAPFIFRSGSMGNIGVHGILTSRLSGGNIDPTKIAFSVVDADGRDMGFYVLDLAELSAAVRDNLLSIDEKKPA